MLKRITAGIIVALLLISCIPCTAAEVTYIYVSPNGNDSASGSIDAPLKTIKGAVSRVSSLKKSGDIHIVFKGGNYSINETINFEKNIAGNKNCKIYFEAAKDEKVNFTGGRKLDFTKFKTVTDEEVLKRLPEESKGKVIALDLREQGIESLDRVDFKRSANVMEKEYYSLFFNGKREMLSQWPNGENNFTQATEVLSNTTFRYQGSRPLRWQKADQLYMSGWMKYDYGYERAEIVSIDIEESTITLKPTLYFGMMSTSAKRWQVLNLLEEIDIPGEWFIDINTYMLYYYPHREFKEDDLLEMSFFNKYMLNFTDVNTDYYITFDGITFTQTRHAVVAGGGRNITFSDCTFSYIDGDAVILKGICNRFEGCRFIYISGYAFEIMNYGSFYSDDEEYIIRNCYFTKCATHITSALSAISTSTHNLVIENNIFHNQYGGAAALGWDTYEAKVRYNEVYNCERELSDCGTFYCGRQHGDPRNEFAYNLMYDIHAKSKYLPSAVAGGIYMDDTFSGAYIHHNILVDINYCGIIIGGGHNNIVENNIIFDVGYGPMLTDNRGETWASLQNDKATYSAQAAAGLAKGDMAKKYPWLADGINYTLQPIHNVFRYNISAKDLNVNERMTELGTVKDNVVVSNYNDFVDPENLDFRIKKGSKLDELCPDGLNEENFSMDMIGVTDEVMAGIGEEYRTFEKLYPSDGAKEIVAQGLMLTWQEAIPADEYRVVIAKDKDLKDVIADFISPYPFCEVEEYVKSGESTYYWTVTAINKSINHASEWKCNDGVSSFTTTKYDKINLEDFNLEISQTESLLKKVSPQTYYESAINNCSEVLKELKAYKKLPESEITNEKTAELLSKLSYASSQLKKSRIINEYVWDKDYFAADKWKVRDGFEDNVAFGDGEITITGSSKGRTDLTYREEPLADILHTFDMKVEFDEDKYPWMGIEMYRRDVTKDIWDDRGYLIVLKKDQSEVQRYGGGIVDTIVDDTFMDGEFHKINIGAIQKIGSVTFIFKVDDVPYYEYTDFEPFTDGYFNFRVPNGMKVTIRPHEEKINEATSEWYGTLYSKEFSGTKDGVWKENGTTSDASASITYDFKMGEGTYAIFLEKKDIENASEKANVTLDIDYVSGREGDERQYIKTVDLSDKNGKWEYVASFKDVLKGAKVKVSASEGKSIGEGKLKIIRLENGYETLAELLGNDKNTVTVKAENKKAFIGHNSVELSAPAKKTGNEVFVPLRSVCENTWLSVGWNEEKRCATVEYSGKTLEFYSGDGVYNENGTMFVSAKKLADSLGKKVIFGKDDVVVITSVAISLSDYLTGLFN